MNQLIISLSAVSVQLLPTVILAFLIYLIILIYKLIKLTSQLLETTKEVDKSVFLINHSMEKMQKPIDSVVKISETVDAVHDKSLETVKNLAIFIAENTEVIKERIKSKNSLNNIKEEIKNGK